MDPLSIAANILKLAGKINDAIETVNHNKRLCSSIRENVEIIGDILLADENTRIMSVYMRRPLRNLEKALEEALDLIKDCQKKSKLARMLTADQISKRLHDANQKIFQSMQIVHFAMTSLQLAPSMQDPYANSREEDKEWYYSCSSSCSVFQMKAMIKDLPQNNIIEQNGDYIMYKVTLSDGPCVAVHRIGRFGAATANAEHEIQVRGTAKLEHINILELLGYFSHQGFFYMVDAESFGILSNCIYDSPWAGNELSWQWCSDIILDIADGVVYLHEHGVIHMSLCLTTIEISHRCVAKIGHFDISQILNPHVQEGEVTTLEMKWGYAPPEYERYSRFSVKTDVYSYGILLLELITGNMCNLGGDNYNSLTASVVQHMLENNMRKCIQPRLINAADGPQIEDIKRCIHIALLCVEEDPTLRPTMHDVLGWLGNKRQVLPRIHKPAYITKDTVTDRDMVRPNDSSAVDLYHSSRMVEREEYYSCSSSCSVSQLKAMLKDLLEENIIEQNGDFIMYKVTLSDRACIVRRIGQIGAATTTAEQEIRVRDVAKLEHVNILELLGYFSHRRFLYMVYAECFGVLSTYIYDSSLTGNELSWQWCSDIILDIADGVVYLHDCDVIHMSLHPSTIGISYDSAAKIANFQISEILNQYVMEGEVTTLEMEWGYAPPEYESYGRFSVKTDVYSYGVLLLELITGKKCNQRSDNYDSLAAWVLQRALANNVIKCIQPRLIHAADGSQIEDIKRCIRIALLCVEEDQALRPTMHDVRTWLWNRNHDLPRISAIASIQANDFQ